MKTFKEFLTEQVRKDIAEEEKKHVLNELQSLFEHQTYNRIPGTQNSYRQDSGNTNTQTQTHSHVYAKSNGRGKEIYSVNLDGSGHDGSSGTEIPVKHANFFRLKGYSVNSDNILESISVYDLEQDKYTIVFMEDSQQRV